MLPLKLLLVAGGALFILSWSLVRLFRGHRVDVDELGTIDMNNQRRRDLIELESKRWTE